MAGHPPRSRGGHVFDRLQAWNACHELALAIYRSTEGWPTSERFGLTAQARRAVVSASANIAEGSVRRGPREFRRFLENAIGSLAELTALLRLAKDLGYLQSPSAGELEILRDHASRLTWGLYSAISARAKAS